ncbi:MAG TPA: TVP38/TMEM64 family protein, partial [Planctomycetaceae bacterium]|nr:TVP38/TMEM64 family protein [Planctomycetaceae bacterium]
MDEKNRSSESLWKKLGLITVIVIAAAVGYSQFGEALTLENLAAQEAELKDFQQKHPLMVYGVAFAIYVAVTGLSLPGAAVLTLTCGWFFGLPRGFVLVSFASTTGATVAFLVSRYLLREPIQNRFGERLKTFNQSLEREGAFYLFMLRLIPAVPFFVINVVMGLTPIRARTFWWVSQLGMLPGTAVYVYVGASV